MYMYAVWQLYVLIARTCGGYDWTLYMYVLPGMDTSNIHNSVFIMTEFGMEMSVSTQNMYQ